MLFLISRESEREREENKIMSVGNSLQSVWTIIEKVLSPMREK